MIYLGDIKDNAGKAIPGAKLTFYQAGTAVASFPVNAAGRWTLDDSMDGGLLSPGFTATFNAPGYIDYSLDAPNLPNEFFVTLIRKTNANIALLAGGAAVALLLANSKGKGKRVGATENKKSFSLPPWLVQIAPIAIMGGVALYFINKKDPKEGDSDKLPALADSQLSDLNKKGLRPTINTATAEAISAQIVEATDDCGTDEDSLYNAFAQLHNDADMWLLIKQFGVRQIKSCFSGDYFSNTPYNLVQIIGSELSSSNISDLNAILGQNGLAYKF